MFATIGLIVVFGPVLGGYVMHHGQLAVLYQPTEYLIIGGAAIGTLVIATPLGVIKRVIPQGRGIFSSWPGKKENHDCIVMTDDFFVLSK